MSASDVGGSARCTVAEILAKLGTDPKTGLNPVQLQKRLSKYGPNALPEERKTALSAFLAYFWGPIPWMIEAAALMALIVGDWGDLTIITSLLLFNALLGFWEEHEASNPLDALKNSLALKARVLRSGKWEEVDARTLVPGDIVRLYLGDVVPGDSKLIQGDYISIDQSALTGESLPVTKKSGEDAYSGSVVKEGEMVAVITATGVNTFFWTHRKTSGRRWERFSLPESRNEDRELPNYPGAGFSSDPCSQPSFRYARPLRSGCFVKARRNRSYPFGSIGACGHACRAVRNDGTGRADACQQ
jgi:E1-E2 ATPase/cation transport ATPase-like protein